MDISFLITNFDSMIDSPCPISYIFYEVFEEWYFFISNKCTNFVIVFSSINFNIYIFYLQFGSLYNFKTNLINKSVAFMIFCFLYRMAACQRRSLRIVGTTGSKRYVVLFEKKDSYIYILQYYWFVKKFRTHSKILQYIGL